MFRIASLDDALRLSQAIFDHYAGKPTAPFNVAKALNIDPKGSQLKLLSDAAIAFGLTEGGAHASVITPTELARRVIRPKVEDEDAIAKREAVLKPRNFGEFLRNYDGNQFPSRLLRKAVADFAHRDSLGQEVGDSDAWRGRDLW